VIDRDSLRSWQEAGSPDAFDRAHARVNELVAAYRRPEMPASLERELFSFMETEARRTGMSRLPGIANPAQAGAA